MRFAPRKYRSQLTPPLRAGALEMLEERRLLAVDIAFDAQNIVVTDSVSDINLSLQPTTLHAPAGASEFLLSAELGDHRVAIDGQLVEHAGMDAAAQPHLAIAQASDGGRIVAWSSVASGAEGIFVQRVDLDGEAIGPAQLVADVNPELFQGGAIGMPVEITATQDGRHAIAWADANGLSVVLVTGEETTPPTSVVITEQTLVHDQFSLTVNHNNEVVVVFTDGDRISQQRLAEDGNLAGPTDTLHLADANASILRVEATQREHPDYALTWTEQAAFGATIHYTEVIGNVAAPAQQIPAPDGLWDFAQNERGDLAIIHTIEQFPGFTTEIDLYGPEGQLKANAPLPSGDAYYSLIQPTLAALNDVGFVVTYDASSDFDSQFKTQLLGQTLNALGPAQLTTFDNKSQVALHTNAAGDEFSFHTAWLSIDSMQGSVEVHSRGGRPSHTPLQFFVHDEEPDFLPPDTVPVIALSGLEAFDLSVGEQADDGRWITQGVEFHTIGLFAEDPPGALDIGLEVFAPDDLETSLWNVHLVLSADGDDRLALTANRDVVDGGAGIDTLLLPGRWHDFELSTYDGVAAIRYADGDTDFVKNVERFRFEDILLPLEWLDDPIPTAKPDAYTAEEDTLLEVSTADGLLSNDGLEQLVERKAEVSQAPHSGSLQLDVTGSFAFRPEHNYSGTTEFSYQTSWKFFDNVLPGAIGTWSGTSATGLPQLSFDQAPIPLMDGEQYQVELELAAAQSSEGPIILRLDNGDVLVDRDAQQADLTNRPGPLAFDFVKTPAHAGLEFFAAGDATVEFNVFRIRNSDGDILISTDVRDRQEQTVTVAVDAVADAALLETTTTVESDFTRLTVLAQTTDASELLELVLVDITPGTFITDGTLEFTSTAETSTLDLHGWDKANLNVHPASDAATQLIVVATSMEPSNGDIAVVTDFILIPPLAAETVAFLPITPVVAPPPGPGPESPRLPPAEFQQPQRPNEELVSQSNPPEQDRRPTRNANESAPATGQEAPPVVDPKVDDSEPDKPEDAPRQFQTESSGEGRVDIDDAAPPRVASDAMLPSHAAPYTMQVFPDTRAEDPTNSPPNIVALPPPTKSAPPPTSFTVGPSAEVEASFDSAQLFVAVDEIFEQLEEATSKRKLLAGTGVVVAMGFSVGQVAWMLRGSLLVSKLLATVPTWVSFDPLPLLESTPKTPDSSGPQESLSDIANSLPNETP